MSSMVIGTGVDIVKIERFCKIIRKVGRGFLCRNFTQEEIDYCNKKINKFQHFAARFACKEAISKALKMNWEKGLNWKEIEIINNHSGAAQAKLSGQAKETADNLKIRDIHLSISHCQDYAVALAVIT